MDFRADKFHLEQLLTLDHQFLLGSHIMINPVVVKGERRKKTYFPDELFYNFYTGEAMNPNGETVLDVDAGLNILPMFLRAGFITPIQEADNTITRISSMRSKPIELIVALDYNHQASGRIFFDDGESKRTIENHEYYRMDVIASQINESFYEITFKYFDMHYVKPENEYPGINKIRILGMKHAINRVEHHVVGSDKKNEISNFRIDNLKKVMFIRDLNFSMTDKHVHKLIMEIDKPKK
jgi:alpha-glucosidase (family GH31 glycosyl hydrolase)